MVERRRFASPAGTGDSRRRAGLVVLRQIHASRAADCAAAVARARAAADGGDPVEVRAGGAQRFQIVAQGEGDPFQHALRQGRQPALVAEPGENAADGGVVVRRALAGEVGQEDFLTRALRRVAEFLQQLAFRNADHAGQP